jgi:zinc protease
MKRRDWIRTAAGAAAAASWLSADEIPAHPRELKFSPLSFEPPSADEHRHKLIGGATAYLVEDHELPLVSVRLTARIAGHLVPDEHLGLGGFTGSQMRGGGTTSMSAREFDEEAAFLATQISSSIGATSGGGSVNCLTQNLDASLAMFFDMLKNPAFDPERLEVARTQTLQGMARRNDQLRAIQGREFARLMRGDNHFTTKQSNEASIKSLTPELMREFHHTYYDPTQFIFAVSGDFETDDMIKRLNAALADGWPSDTKDPGDIPAPTHRPKPGVYMVNKLGRDINQSSVAIGHIGIARSNPDHIAVDIMNDILGGGGFISRIMSRVRSDEGLAYSAGSSYRAGTYYPGLFQAAFQSKNPTCAQATEIVFEEIERIRKDKVTALEIDTAKNAAIEIFPRFFATAGQIAGTFASDQYTKREAGYWEKYRERVADVSIDDVLNVAQKYLKPESLVVLGVGDQAAMLAGNPDKPDYSFEKFAGEGEIHSIPLPDPMTMEYPTA